MSALSHLALCLCYISVVVTVISLFLPQKRTRKVFSFVIGLFVICSLISVIRNVSVSIGDFEIKAPDPLPAAAQEYQEQVKQMTVENLVAATDELLRSEGIEAKDISITLKISDEGRIYVEDVVIYISENDLFRKQDVQRIIYGNLAKEPRVYVEKEKMAGADQE